MLRSNKEQIVEELTDLLRQTETLIVADYRGLTMKEIDALRGELLQHGARFTVVKNSLTRRAADAAGADIVLTLLEGPTAIAFLEADGDPVAVAKALAESARTTKVLTVRGGVLEGSAITASEIEALAKLPPTDVLRTQVLGAIASPLYAVVGLFAGPLQDLHGLLEARIDQLGGAETAAPAEAVPETSEEVEEQEAPAEPAAEAAVRTDEEPGETEDTEEAGEAASEESEE